MTDRDRLLELLHKAPKGRGRISNYELANYLLANGVFLLPEDLRGTEDFSVSAFVEAMQMYKEKDRYIKTPCKVGDMVYVIMETSCEDIDGAYTVCEFYKTEFEDLCTFTKGKCPYQYIIEECLVTEINLLSFTERWNKTVFLTKEEAEAELQKEREG